MPVPLSVLMVVKNEQDRLSDALDSVSWAEEIVASASEMSTCSPELARPTVLRPPCSGQKSPCVFAW